MSVPLSSTKLRLPSGFNPLIHGFCYEILKSQPEDIHAFGAIYFAKLLDKREGNKNEENERVIVPESHINQQKNSSQQLHHPVEKDHETPGDVIETNKMMDEVTRKRQEKVVIGENPVGADIESGGGIVTIGNDKTRVLVSNKTKEMENTKPEVEEVIDIDLEDPGVKKAASLIQIGFKGRMARKKLALKSNVEVEKETKPEDTKIQIIEEAKVFTKSQSKTDDIDHLREKSKMQEVAATKIQAGVRGMLVRKTVKPIKHEQVSKKSEDENENDDEKKKKAATKIQSGIRGMQTRKRIINKKEMMMDNVDDSNEKKYENNESGDDYNDDDADVDDNDKTQKQYQAAGKIQAGYKGMKTRQSIKENKEKAKQVKNGEEKQEDLEADEKLNKSATKIQAGIRGMNTRKELKSRTMKLDRSYSLSHAQTLSTHEDIDKAAKKIQAGVRGMQVRKDFKKQQSEGGNLLRGSPSYLVDNKEDLDTEELNKAAIKIQAGARGMKVRRDLKRIMSEGGENDILLSEKDKAVVKIQAGIRGMNTRKQLKNRKQMTIDDSWRRIEEEEQQNDEQQNVNKAAIKIQAGVRGMQARRTIKRRNSLDVIVLGDSIESQLKETSRQINPEEAATKIQAGIRGMRTRQDLKKNIPNQDIEKPTLKQYGQTSVDFDRAATKIQAGVRGMKTRKNMELHKAPWKTFDGDALESDDFD